MILCPITIHGFINQKNSTHSNHIKIIVLNESAPLGFVLSPNGKNSTQKLKYVYTMEIH
jgi:hypothetical protein